ncbi:MAG: hypothetical protein AAF901_10065 [Bacteroidota bacterium]
MKTYKATILFLMVSLMLGVPFALKLISGSLEMYPAVIFPSGASVVKTENGTTSFHSIELWGYKNNIPSKLDTDQFLNPIPNWYLPKIVEGHFGLKPYRKELQHGLIPFIIKTENDTSESALEETKAWIRGRLKAQGFDDSGFMVRTYLISYSIETKAMVSTSIINETVYEISE